MSRLSLTVFALVGVGVCGCLHGTREAPRNLPAPDRSRPAVANCPRSAGDYPWPHSARAYEPLAGRIPDPPGFVRVPVTSRSWGEWLRYLPLMPAGTPVRTREGTVAVPADSPHLAAVVDMDVRRNQECSDTIQRLRAEYLAWVGREGEISFRLGDGRSLRWSAWKQGERPYWDGRRLHLRGTGSAGGTRASFEGYLDAVFAWCGAHSLAQDGEPVRPEDVQIGDYFARGGQPGHAVLIVDLARNGAERTRALIVQGYMPAQSAHVLAPGPGDPWFELDPQRPVATPFWGAFQWSELRRFKTVRE